MLARKKFKGGNLDDFLDAGKAEARFGPSRYAAVAEDAWKITVEKKQSDLSRRQSNAIYAAQKRQMLSDHAFLSVLGTAAIWALASEQATGSYVAGALLGGLYTVLLQKQADSVGAAQLGEQAPAAPPPIVVPVLMVLLVSKYRFLMLLPTLGGFVTCKLATLAQLVYPDDFGVQLEDEAAA